MYFKDFSKWSTLKIKINEKDSKFVSRKGEIRWCNVGVNIAEEIDGKGASFIRPILIIKNLGNKMSFVIPLTSKDKDGAGYMKIEYKNKIDSLCLHQARFISQKKNLNKNSKD
jgi:mRNA interferase MazF